MKFQEKHNEFAVKCYTKYMNTGQVVQVFIEKFAHELPHSSPPPIHQILIRAIRVLRANPRFRKYRITTIECLCNLSHTN